MTSSSIIDISSDTIYSIITSDIISVGSSLASTVVTSSGETSSIKSSSEKPLFSSSEESIRSSSVPSSSRITSSSSNVPSSTSISRSSPSNSSLTNISSEARSTGSPSESSSLRITSPRVYSSTNTSTESHNSSTSTNILESQTSDSSWYSSFSLSDITSTTNDFSISPYTNGSIAYSWPSRISNIIQPSLINKSWHTQASNDNILTESIFTNGWTPIYPESTSKPICIKDCGSTIVSITGTIANTSRWEAIWETRVNEEGASNGITYDSAYNENTKSTNTNSISNNHPTVIINSNGGTTIPFNTMIFLFAGLINYFI